MTWEDSKAWSDRFLPEIKMILGRRFISEPAVEEDALRNTDLIVFKMEAIRIACRIRKPEYYEKYGDQFTIRSERPSGMETELAKIVRGWGDYFFYGFGGKRRLADWRIGDLDVFRLWFHLETVRLGREPGVLQKNRDGSSDFRGFRWDELPKDFVIERMDARYLDAIRQLELDA
jgi:hypothetical protein